LIFTETGKSISSNSFYFTSILLLKSIICSWLRRFISSFMQKSILFIPTAQPDKVNQYQAINLAGQDLNHTIY